MNVKNLFDLKGKVSIVTRAQRGSQRRANQAGHREVARP